MERDGETLNKKSNRKNAAEDITIIESLVGIGERSNAKLAVHSFYGCGEGEGGQDTF